jgi:uncharacterized glyoxalase superfamily protein PhnB
VPDESAAIFPFLRYEDANEAIRFLTEAFGFQEHSVFRDDDGTVVHAELRLGSGIVMLAQMREGNQEQLQSPRRLGGQTQGIYVAVDDVDAHCERARAAGADITREPEDQDYGSRDYTVRDPEGHTWSFGTYRPSIGET